MDWHKDPAVLAILLVGLTALAGISGALLTQDSNEMTGASSFSKLLKKMKRHVPRPPPIQPTPQPPTIPVPRPPSPQPAQPIPIIPVTPVAPAVPLPPSCQSVSGGRGQCMTRYCDTGPNSLDVVYGNGYCPDSRAVCCAKGELASKPDTALTCDQVRAKYGASGSSCITQLPCRGSLGALPRYIGRTLNCNMCCIGTGQ